MVCICQLTVFLHGHSLSIGGRQAGERLLHGNTHTHIFVLRSLAQTHSLKSRGVYGVISASEARKQQRLKKKLKLHIRGNWRQWLSFLVVGDSQCPKFLSFLPSLHIRLTLSLFRFFLCLYYHQFTSVHLGSFTWHIFPLCLDELNCPFLVASAAVLL